MKIRDRILELRRVKASDLKAAPHNWRTHPKNQHSALRGSLEQLGYYDALIARRLEDGTLEIIDGHLRAEISPDEAVPVLVTDLTEAEAKAALLTHDPLAALAGQDDALLKALADTVDLGDDGLAAMIQDMLPPGPDDVVEDEVPDPPAEPITRPGDLWRLGVHRLLCGDSTKAEDMARVINKARVSAVLTDPPYGIGYNYESHNDSEKSWYPLMNKIVPILRNVSQIVVMPCCRIACLDWWYANHRPDWIIAWYKGSPGHRSHIGFNDWEPHLVWGKPKKYMHDYFQTACGFEIDGHPCPKPVAWGAWLCERICERGNTIFDPFLGSGTTLIAAEQLGRTCYGLEVEPRYCDVIVQRWENLTGKKASRDAQS